MKYSVKRARELAGGSGFETGEVLGYGMSRVVLEIVGLVGVPRQVAKVDMNFAPLQNMREWDLWREVIDMPDASRHLAPVKELACDGRVLIQARTTVPTEFPEQLPVWLSDTKRRNYGMLDGRFVCHDYGTHMAYTHGIVREMRPVTWRDGDKPSQCVIVKDARDMWRET